jgi:hypothetical protein
MELGESVDLGLMKRISTLAGPHRVGRAVLSGHLSRLSSLDRLVCRKFRFATSAKGGFT